MIHKADVLDALRTVPGGIETVLGFYLTIEDRPTGWKRASCPLCGDTDVFTVRPEDGSWKCRRCGHGDLLELLNRYWCRDKQRLMFFPDLLAEVLVGAKQLGAVLPEHVQEALDKQIARGQRQGARPVPNPRPRLPARPKRRRVVDVRQAVINAVAVGPGSTRDMWRRVSRRRSDVSQMLAALQAEGVIQRHSLPDRRGVVQDGLWVLANMKRDPET